MKRWSVRSRASVVAVEQDENAALLARPQGDELNSLCELVWLSEPALRDTDRVEDLHGMVAVKRRYATDQDGHRFDFAVPRYDGSDPHL